VPHAIGAEAPECGEVVIAVATYRRPELLRELLPELIRQSRALATRSRVVVVDNDPEGGARDVVSALAASDVDYLHEPRPGIAAARNHALDRCGGNDVIVFIDDDEFPTPEWLGALVRSWQAWGCAGVSGPALATFEVAPDAWVQGSGVFARPAKTDGAAVSGAATNNLLLHVGTLRSMGLRFDDAYGTSGGSDTRLVHDLISRGGVVRWCDAAAVLDRIPASRTSREWVLRRTMRTSNTWSRVALDLAKPGLPRLQTALGLTGRAAYRLLRGASTTCRGYVGGDPRIRARGECDIASAIGMVQGAYGVVRSEYARA